MFFGHDQLQYLIDVLRDMSSTAAFFSILGMLVLCGMGLPMPEDIILVTAGMMAALEKFHVITAVVLGMVGVLSGDAALFFLGRHFGERVLNWRGIRYIARPDQIEAARERVLANEKFICFIARFLPGLRSPIYLVAGAMGVPPRVYLTQDGLAATISVPVWVLVGWWFGRRLDEALEFVTQYERFILLLIVLVVAGWGVHWLVQRYRQNKNAS